MTVLLKDAIKPNLVQTLEGQPCLMHCGPFANIAHGNNSLLADMIARKIGDYVVTESGFGSDMGMTKFMDIVCRMGGFVPSAVVLVVTVRAIKHHGGGDDDAALVLRHGERQAPSRERRRVRRAVRRRRQRPRGRHDEELERTRELCLEAGAYAAAINDGFGSGGAGAAELAEKVVEACEQPNNFSELYPIDAPIATKIETIATRIFGAADVDFSPVAQRKIDEFTELGLDNAPGLHGEDAPLALARVLVAQRAVGLHAPGARHPRVHGRRLARPAVRRDPADAGPGQEARGVRHRHRCRRPHGRSVLSGAGRCPGWDSNPQALASGGF